MSTSDYTEEVDRSAERITRTLLLFDATCHSVKKV